MKNMCIYIYALYYIYIYNIKSYHKYVCILNKNVLKSYKSYLYTIYWQNDWINEIHWKTLYIYFEYDMYIYMYMYTYVDIYV